MDIRESGEMYLETIYILSKKKSDVRAIDIGEQMGYSKPSVSRAIGVLKQRGYVTADAQGFIRLTEEGEKKAAVIYERHTLLTQLLISIGVDEKTAAEDACRVEHYISEETFAAIKKHVRAAENRRS